MKLYFNTGYILTERFYEKSVIKPTLELDVTYKDMMRAFNYKDYAKFLGIQTNTRAKIISLPTDPVIIKYKKIS